METVNGDRTQSSFTVVSDAYRNENENNCFLREDVFIDFNYLVTDLDSDEIKAGTKEEISNSRDTSETESATEEVEEVDIKLIGDNFIIFQSEDDIKEAYPNLQAYYESQNIQQTPSVVDDLHSNTKQELNYISEQYQEVNSVQGLTSINPLENGMKNESKVSNKQDHTESTLEPSYYYYIDSYPLTKNPPDSTYDSNNGTSSIEGSYTVEGGDSTQSALGGDILQIPKEEPNEIEQYAAEENDNNIVIISMKKFVVDQVDQLASQPSNQLIKSSIPSRKWKRLYECVQCGKKFSHSVNLQIHMEVHTHELHPHKCVECGVSFAKSRQLLRHLKKHTAPKKKILDCPICEATYKTYGHLRHHLIVVHGVENVNPDSNPLFAPRSSAQILIIKPKNRVSSTNIPLNSSGSHTGNVPNYFQSRESLIENNKIAEDLLKCPVCSKIYKSRGSFVKHVRLHKEEEFPVNGTAVCDNKTNLFQSEKKAHGVINSREELMPGELSSKCSMCGSCFKDFVTMIKHKRANHRPFKCRKKFCKAKFSHRHLLNRHLLESHLKTHLKRPFKCRTCDSSFTTETSYLHWRADFSSGTPYRCAVCFSAIIAKSNLERYRCNPGTSNRMEPAVQEWS